MSSAVRYVLISMMWFTVVVQLGLILGELTTLERVIRNIDSTTVTITNAMPMR